MHYAVNRPRRITPSTIAIVVALLILAAIIGWSLSQRPALTVAAPATLPTTMPQPQDAAHDAPAPSLLPLEAHMTPHQVKQYEQARFSTFESRYRQDGVDAAWAAQTEEKMLEAATEPALNEFGTPTAYEADCHAHLCKISMDFKTLSSAQDWEQFYVTGLGGALTRVSTNTQVGPDGKINLIIYGTRGGAEALLDFAPPAGENSGSSSKPQS